MGEAKDIVKGAAPNARRADVHEDGLLGQLTEVIELLDEAIEIKQQDLAAEGSAALAENHFKLGLLQGSMSLLRRSRAMLEDYGSIEEANDDAEETF